MLLTHMPSTASSSYCEDADDGNSSSPNQPSSSLLVSSIFSMTSDQQVDQEIEQFKQALDHHMLLDTITSRPSDHMINSGQCVSSCDKVDDNVHPPHATVKGELLMSIDMNDRVSCSYSPRVCASCNDCITDDFYLRTTPVIPGHRGETQCFQNKSEYIAEQSKYNNNSSSSSSNCLSWHINRGCLRCSRCGQPLQGQNSCFMYNGNILCKSDYEYVTCKENSLNDQVMYTPRYRCFRCHAFFGPREFVIRIPTPNGQYLLTGPWMYFHPNCFSCDHCGIQLNKGTLYSLQGTNILCQLHSANNSGKRGGGGCSSSSSNANSSSRTCKSSRKDASSVTRSPLCQTSSYSMSRSAPVKSPKKRGPKAGSTRGARSKKLLSGLVDDATATRNVSPTVSGEGGGGGGLESTIATTTTTLGTSLSPSASCTSSSFQFSQANPSRKYESTSTKNGQ